MNREIIFYNLEIVRKYLGKNMQDFSTMFNKEQSYYRKVIKHDNTMPSLDFIVKICEYLHIKIDRFLNEKLKIKLIFEEDDCCHNGETNE